MVAPLDTAKRSFDESLKKLAARPDRTRQRLRYWQQTVRKISRLHKLDWQKAAALRHHAWDRVADWVAEDCKQRFHLDRDRVRAAIDEALATYDGAQFWAFAVDTPFRRRVVDVGDSFLREYPAVPIDDARDTLDELAKPLAKVLSVLEDEVNQNRLMPKLIGDGRNCNSSETCELFFSMLPMLREILEVAAAAHHGDPEASPKKEAKQASPGRTTKRPDLYTVVDLICHRWEELSGKEVTWTWNKNGQSLAMQFVEAVISCVAPEHLDKLKNVAIKGVKKRFTSNLTKRS